MCTGSKHNKTRYTSVRAAVAVVLLSVLFAWSGNAAVSGAAVSNYVRTYVFTDSTGSDSRAREQTQYYDGLGRQVLEVSGATAVPDSYTAQLTHYNASGTVSRKWLPVPGGAENIDISAVVNNAASVYGQGQAPYTSYGYDTYPLRLLSETGPGAFWQNKRIRHPRHSCAASGDYMCRKILVDISDGTVRVVAPYADGEIRIDETVDEDSMRTIVFENSSGKTVLQRRIGTDGLVADTRYVYDIRGDLRYVISPEGCRLLPDSGAVPAKVTDSCAQCYRYDFRHRLISYKLPGCGWEEYIYDKYGNLLLSSDAVQRAKSEWTFTLYDSRMRPAVRGTCKFTGKTPEQLRAQFADSALTATFVGETGVYFCQYSAAVSKNAFTPYIAWYYDNYDFLDCLPQNHKSLFEDTSSAFTATGLQTGSATVIAADEAFYTASRYDAKGNVIYSEERDSYLQRYRLSVSSAYDFTGNETSHTEKYEKMTEQSVVETHTACFTTTHDDMGRVHTQHLGVDGRTPILLLSNEYDAVGRLSAQWRGTAVAYGYDVRSHRTLTSSDIYTERVHYAAESGADRGLVPGRWPSYRFANRIEENWAQRSDTLPVRELDWYMYYDGLGRLRSGISDDSLYSESIDTDLDANVRSLRRVFRGADIQNSVISYTAGMATGVRDVSAPYYGERVGRIPAGDYTLAYDVAGRLVADGTRGITGITYKDWSDIPQSVTAAGFSVFSDVSADGKLRLRRTHVPYIETVIKVNSKGDTIVSQRKRTLTRSSQFFGCFENATTPAGSHLRVNTPVGFYDLREKRQYWYLTNRQESVMALVDSEGNVHRRSALYPSGTPFVLDGDDDNVPDAGLPSDRHHIGNHWISFGGLDWYDNTARMHDPVLMHFITPDKHAHEYAPLSPWSHCAANPVNYADRNGQWLESLWDFGNVVMGVTSAVNNFSNGNIIDGFIDVGGTCADIVALAVPGLPGGASSAIRAERAGEKAVASVATAARHETTSIVDDVAKQTTRKTSQKITVPNRSNYKKEYEKVYGPVPEKTDVHHMLPQKYESKFNKACINIHETKWLKAVDSHYHHKISYDYNNEWDKFFNSNPNPTQDKIIKEMRKLDNKFFLSN